MRCARTVVLTHCIISIFRYYETVSPRARARATLCEQRSAAAAAVWHLHEVAHYWMAPSAHEGIRTATPLAASVTQGMFGWRTSTCLGGASACHMFIPIGAEFRTCRTYNVMTQKLELHV